MSLEVKDIPSKIIVDEPFDISFTLINRKNIPLYLSVSSKQEKDRNVILIGTVEKVYYFYVVLINLLASNFPKFLLKVKQHFH